MATQQQQPVDRTQVSFYPDGSQVLNEYDLRPGVCIIPVAEAPPTDLVALRTWSPVVVLKLHAPYRLRRVRYESFKQNNPPIMPAPESAGAFVFVGGAIVFSNGLNQSGVAADWKTRTEYSYVENCVSRTEDGFVLGVTPYGTLNIDQQTAAQYPPTNTQIGAVAQAGTAAKIGFTMGQAITQAVTANRAWAYTVCSFAPGTLFNNQIANGGGATVAG